MKRWAKEDRYSWENSEVMKEFESKTLSNYSFLEKSAAQKVNSQELQQLKKDMDSAKQSAIELNKALSAPVSAADDGMSLKECQCNEAEDCEICRVSDDDYSDDEVKLAKAAIIFDLKKMADDAIRSGNIKLAYKIERPISEVEEE